jgi:hypothetical protein
VDWREIVYTTIFFTVLMMISISVIPISLIGRSMEDPMNSAYLQLFVLIELVGLIVLIFSYTALRIRGGRLNKAYSDSQILMSMIGIVIAFNLSITFIIPITAVKILVSSWFMSFMYCVLGWRKTLLLNYLNLLITLPKLFSEPLAIISLPFPYLSYEGNLLVFIVALSSSPYFSLFLTWYIYKRNKKMFSGWFKLLESVRVD